MVEASPIATLVDLTESEVPGRVIWQRSQRGGPRIAPGAKPEFGTGTQASPVMVERPIVRRPGQQVIMESSEKGSDDEHDD